MIRLQDYSIGFKNRMLLENVSTEFAPSVLTALIGRNGSGKSTLMKSICGLNPKYGGQIFIDDENLRNISPLRLAKLVAYVNTSRPRMANLKCIDIVSLGRTPYTAWHGKISDKDKDLAMEALRLVGMEDFALRDINRLSDGESEKIMIARAIAQDTQNLILDEPTSFLDLPTRFELVRLLRKLAHEKGKTILFSTHELDIALNMCDMVALVDNFSLLNISAKEMAEVLKSSGHPFSMSGITY